MTMPKKALANRRDVRFVRTKLREGKKVGALAQIDRSSPEPFYIQLAKQLEQAIDSGEYAVGGRLPGESELCRQYDLARSTVREMLRNLEEKGKIKLVPRRGAFVVDPNESAWGLQVTTGFFEGEVDHNKRNVETAVLEARRGALPEAAAVALSLRKGEEGFRLRRLRKLDGVLALYSENCLPAEFERIILESEVMQPHGSLNRVLRAAGYKIFGARRSIESVAAPNAVAKKLQIPQGSPLLLITSISWGKDRKVFDHYTSWVRTDVVKITVEAQATTDET